MVNIKPARIYPKKNYINVFLNPNFLIKTIFNGGTNLW